MARITRLIIYESDDDALTKQIEKSLPEGVHDLDVKITVLDVTDIPALIEKLILK